MTTPTNPQNDFSPFLPTTVNFPEEQERLKTFLVDTFAQYADVINDKKIGLYLDGAEVLNGDKLGYDDPKITRNGFQYLARIESYPANGSITLTPPPNINPQFMLIQAWGSASKPPLVLGDGTGDFFSFYGSGNPKITFTFSDLAIIVTTNGLGTGYSGFIICEYLHDGF
jgi:hypothetical protein